KTIEMFDLMTPEAHLFSPLYIMNKPLTLVELGEAMGKSKTVMSISIRSLLYKNMVTRVWSQGVRKDLYQESAPLLKTFMQTYMNKWIYASSSQKEDLENIKKMVHAVPQTKRDAAFKNMENRLDEMIIFHEQIEKTFQQIF